MSLIFRSPTFDIHRIIDLSLDISQKEFDSSINEIAKIIGLAREKLNRWTTERERMMRLIALNAAQAHVDWPQLWVSYSRDSSKLFGKLPRKTFLNAIDGLAEAGFIETRKGFCDRSGAGESRSPKFRATEKLLSLLRAEGVNLWNIFRTVGCSIVLKNNKKESIGFRNTANVQILKKNIKRINDMIEDGQLSLVLSKGMPVPTIEIGWNKRTETPRKNYRCVPYCLAVKR